MEIDFRELIRKKYGRVCVKGVLAWLVSCCRKLSILWCLGCNWGEKGVRGKRSGKAKGKGSQKCGGTEWKMFTNALNVGLLLRAWAENTVLRVKAHRLSGGPGGGGWRIYRLHLWRWVRPSNECCDMTLNDDEVPMMLELWGMRSTSSLLSLPGSLWLVAVAPDRPCLNRTKLNTYAKQNYFK